MPQNVSAPIFSRIVMLLLAIACLGAAFWFGSQALEPVPIPPPPPAKSKINFNPNADVSRHPVFQRLEPLGPAHVEKGELGRVNPFVPLPPPASATSSEDIVIEPIIEEPLIEEPLIEELPPPPTP
ncbi:MAG: hypothetical protein WC787_02505 [Patescibacteria group bacterium]|jgi:hypothetical protein